MNRIATLTVRSALAAGLLSTTLSCAASDGAEPRELSHSQSAQPQSIESVQHGQMGSAAQNAAPGDELTTNERHHLQQMLEEEKLARDVYLELHDRTGLNVFRNIGAAEQRHMNAVAGLVRRFDPPTSQMDNTRGVFTNATFSELYETLVEDGSSARINALKIGAKIEEMDIVDLRESIAATDNTDLIRVYENLLRASRNHLRAFAGLIEANGDVYKAQHLTQAEFDAIAHSPGERGPGAQQGRGRGGGPGRGRQGTP